MRRDIVEDSRPAVVVVGAGMMGSHIGCEYALGGYDVVWVTRDRHRAATRIQAALSLAASAGLCVPDAAQAAERRMTYIERPDGRVGGVWLVVESVIEDLDVKVAVLRASAAAWPRAILATNTSSIRITELGRMARLEERLLGTHYWSPPLLMPLVEVVRGERTPAGLLPVVSRALRGIGKRPVEVERDVPGFAWNRLQFALLRECLWLLENEVVTSEQIDEIVRDGLARRWRVIGPLATAALGGSSTFDAIAEKLFPVLSNAADSPGFASQLEHSRDELEALRKSRDTGLISELRAERQATRQRCAARDGPLLDQSIPQKKAKARTVMRELSGSPSIGAPAIITCAVSGGIVTGNPNQPRTRADAVEAAVGAVQAGASVLHIHARSVDGEITQLPEDYLAIKEAIRAEVADVVINFTTGAWLGLSPEKRRRSLEAEPDMASLNCGSINFGPAGEVFANTKDYIEDLAQEMDSRGIVREYECFDMGMVITARKLIAEKSGPPGMMHLVMGVVGGAPATTQVLAQFVDWVPDGVPWMVTAVGRSHFPIMASTLALGGHARTGLEDVVYMAPREYAESNAQLVSRVRALCDAIGRPVATPAQAREILSTGSPAASSGSAASMTPTTS